MNAGEGRTAESSGADEERKHLRLCQCRLQDRFRMLQMEIGRTLPRVRHGDKLALLIKPANEGDARRGSRSPTAAWIWRRFGRVPGTKTVGQDDRWMSGQIGDHQLITVSRGDKDVDPLKDLRHLAHQ